MLEPHKPETSHRSSTPLISATYPVEQRRRSGVLLLIDPLNSLQLLAAQRTPTAQLNSGFTTGHAAEWRPVYEATGVGAGSLRPAVYREE